MVARGGARLCERNPGNADEETSSPGGATEPTAKVSVAPPGLRFIACRCPGVALGLWPALHPGLPSVAPPGLQNKPPEPQGFRPSASVFTHTSTHTITAREASAHTFTRGPYFAFSFFF